MWRFWNCIPRVLRQQLHGPRASAGGVCLEEEKQDRNAELINHDKKELDKAACCVQSVCDHEPDASPTGGARPKRGDWSRRQCHANFWSKFSGIQQRTLDAVTWGAALVLGIHLSRQSSLSNFASIVKDPDKKQQWQKLLLRIAITLPPDSFGIEQRVVDQLSQAHRSRLDESVKNAERKASKEKTAAQTAEDGKTLEDAMEDFMLSCQKYAAMGSSVSGVFDAEAGRLTRAVEQLRLSSQLGHAPACFNLALSYQTGSGVEKDLAQAAAYYSKAAEMGHAEAIFNLAVMILEGEGGIVKDRSKGMELMNKAADCGIAMAHTYLGMYYSENDANQQDLERAVSCFSAAASKDDADGQYFLGICFENGWGVENSDAEAAQLYATAAQAGHDGAMYNLAAFYEHGLGGFDRDVEQAMSLYEKSAIQGNESAKFRLQEVKAKQAIDQWAESQRNDTRSSDSAPLSPVSLRHSSCSSSPTLTDHLRNSFSALWTEGLHSWTSRQTLKSAAVFSSDKKVAFSIGDQRDDPTVKEPSVKRDTFPQFCQAQQSCMMDIHRASTMPNLSVVPVQ